MRELVTRLLSIASVLVQAVILDYYIISRNGIAWAPCIISDVITIAVMVCSFVFAHRYVEQHDAWEQDENKLLEQGRKKQTSERVAGILPFIYCAWFVYSCFLTMKIAIIFKTFGSDLSGEQVWGTNLLEFVIAGKRRKAKLWFSCGAKRGGGGPNVYFFLTICRSDRKSLAKWKSFLFSGRSS